MSPPLLESCDEFTPATQGELRRFVAENADGPRRPLYPLGGRTALHFGYPPNAPGTIVSLTKVNATVDYPARDMTITVEPGVRMGDLAAMLREEGQQLPVDAPQANRATLGGVVATDTSGPRRFGYGTMRDYLIGVTAVDGRGREFHAGGRVVKNVAGYDLCKLMVGSLGTLAVVSQLTLKLRPLPETAALLWAGFDVFERVDAVLEDLLTSAARPVVLDVLNREAARQVAAESRQSLPAEGPVLVAAVEGSPGETRWQIGTLKEELSRREPQGIEVAEAENAHPLLRALTEFETASDAPLTFRANLLPSRTAEFLDRADRRGVCVQAHAGNGIVIGHLPDQVTTIEKAREMLTPLRRFAREGRGNLVILDCPQDWASELPLFGEPEQAWPLMRRLKETFDPHGVLNPGRLLGKDARPAGPV